MRSLLPISLWLALAAGTAFGHFQVLLPASDVVGRGDPKAVALELFFTHPMDDGPVMEMAPPKRFGVLVGGKQRDLLASLKPRKLEGKSAYDAVLKIAEPGDYVFFVEPAPYWEPAERKMIVHYTKVVVDALGAEEGWDAMVGFPVEIEPLTRPFGLWTGNTFRGIVRKDGKPVPFATVEVEYLNDGAKVKLPNASFSTQVVKADANGVFAYTCPKAGWWGFAALIDADQPMPGPDGKPVAVELGGLMWVKTYDMQEAGEK